MYACTIIFPNFYTDRYSKRTQDLALILDRFSISIELFCKGALFRGKGGPPVLEKPARHLPRQGRGFVRPPVSVSSY